MMHLVHLEKPPHTTQTLNPKNPKPLHSPPRTSTMWRGRARRCGRDARGDGRRVVERQARGRQRGLDQQRLARPSRRPAGRQHRWGKTASFRPGAAPLWPTGGGQEGARGASRRRRARQPRRAEKVISARRWRPKTLPLQQPLALSASARRRSSSLINQSCALIASAFLLLDAYEAVEAPRACTVSRTQK